MSGNADYRAVLMIRHRSEDLHLYVAAWHGGDDVAARTNMELTIVVGHRP